VGNFGYDDVTRLARGALDEDQEGYRREFLSLVKLADSLTPDGKARVSDLAH
jgi:Ca-activated chloride channel homolog